MTTTTRSAALARYLAARQRPGIQDAAVAEGRARRLRAEIARAETELETLRASLRAIDEEVLRLRREDGDRFASAEAALRAAAPASVRGLLAAVLSRLADPATPAAEIEALALARVDLTALEVADLADAVLDARAAEIRARLGFPSPATGSDAA